MGVGNCEPNKTIVMDSHPLSHMDNILAEMHEATLFSTIDLVSS